MESRLLYLTSIGLVGRTKLEPCQKHCTLDFVDLEELHLCDCIACAVYLVVLAGSQSLLIDLSQDSAFVTVVDQAHWQCLGPRTAFSLTDPECGGAEHVWVWEVAGCVVTASRPLVPVLE